MLRDKTFTDEPIVVSVAMIAYNVGQYLEAAIESVLNQVCDFRVELVIGEDCSTDNTREIALRYQQQYPTIIRVLLPEKNQGLTPNSAATQHACRGEYIALLDGDDYWTDVNKLQLQVTFLNSHPDFSGSSHQSQVVFEDVQGEDRPFGSNNDHTYGVLDTVGHRKFHTSSLVYRKAIWDKTGGIPTTILSNERAIYPMVAVFGKIHYSGKSMCIYRRSSIGISSRVKMHQLQNDLNMIPWLKSFVSSDFPLQRFRSFLHFTTFTYSYSGSNLLALKHFCLFAFWSFSYFPKNLGDIKFGMSELFKNFRYKLN